MKNIIIMISFFLSACSLADKYNILDPVKNNKQCAEKSYTVINNNFYSGCETKKENKKMTKNKKNDTELINDPDQVDIIEQDPDTEIMLDDDESSCGNCFHIEQGDINVNDILDVKYFCRRYPPTTVVLPSQNSTGGMGVQITSIYPVVQKTGYCGEWDESL